MQLATYTIVMTFPALQVTCDHLKQGIYNNVAPILNDIAVQVAKQEHAAEQEKLQQEVSAASAALPSVVETIPLESVTFTEVQNAA